MNLLKQIRWDEILLWLGLAFSTIEGLYANPKDAPTFAGIFVLALIGIRVTRRIADKIDNKNVK